MERLSVISLRCTPCMSLTTSLMLHRSWAARIAMCWGSNIEVTSDAMLDVRLVELAAILKMLPSVIVKERQTQDTISCDHIPLSGTGSTGASLT